MANQFSSGKHSVAVCDRCGWEFKLHELRGEVVAGYPINDLVCDTCWDEDQPQLMLGRYPVSDPQAVRNPRPDTTYPESRAIDIFSTEKALFAVARLGTGTVSVT